MNRKILHIVGWAIALALVIVPMASCAPGGSPGGAPAATTAAPAATTAAQAATAAATTQAAATEPEVKPVTFSYWHGRNADATEGEKKVLELYIEEFQNAFPHITVDSRPTKPGTDYREQYDKALMANDGPTLNEQLPHVDIQTRINNGTIADVSKYMENFDLRLDGKVIDVFDDAIRDKDGKWYAIPIRQYFMAHAYNSETIKAGGESVDNLPTDWESFGEYTQRLTNPAEQRYGYVFIGSDYLAWNFTPWVWAAGGEMVRPNSDGTYSIAFNEEPGIDTAMFWHDLVYKYKSTQTDLLKQWPDLQTDIQAGYSALSWGVATTFAARAEEKFGITPERFGSTLIPGKTKDMSPVSFAGGGVWVMGPKATEEEMDAAWEFVKFTTYNEEFLTKVWEIEGEYNVASFVQMPARNDLADLKFSFAQWPDHWAKEFAQLAEYAIPEPFCANWNDLKNDIVIPMQKVLLTENITREEVKQLLDECADSLYEKYPDSFRLPN
ncbi:MAG: hypothetical protein FWH01_09045 [Oscillospiraceae bacterium]|nr:hypothetical protein [Oscillospiraceae bacterium]